MFSVYDMAAALRTFCLLAALCGTTLRAAPTVTYDQRQNGEFNLQVDVDGVAIVLLPSGEELLVRSAAGDIGSLAGGAFQALGRRSGVHLRKKHKKPASNCTTAATAEKPEASGTEAYGGSPPTPLPLPSPPVTEYPFEENSNPKPLSPESEYPSQESGESKPPAPVVPDQPNGEENGVTVQQQYKSPAPVSESERDVLADADLTNNYLIDDPYSVTPSTPTLSKNPDGQAPADTAAAEMVEVQTVKRPATSAAANSVVNQTAGKPVEFPNAPETPQDTKTSAVVKEIEAILAAFEDKSAKPEEIPKVTVTINVPEKPNGVEIVAKTTAGSERPQVAVAADEPARTNATKTAAEKPTFAEALKTPEKPTFANALKAAKNPVESDTSFRTAVVTEAISTSVDDKKKLIANASLKELTGANAQVDGGRTELPVEMVTVKIADAAVRTASVTEATVSVGLHKKSAVTHVLPKESVEKSASPAGVQSVNGPKTSEKAVEIVAINTAKKPTFVEVNTAVRAAAVTEATVGVHKNGADAAPKKSAETPATALVNGGRTDLPVEMVAMETVEKPITAEVPTTDAKNSFEDAAFAATSSDEKRPETVDAKTSTIIEGDIEKTAVRDEKIAAVAGFVPKSATEMVAVKMMENPVTVMTVKTVTSVKTVVKSGTPKTAVSSNGSSILRKVADRKPLPSMTFQVVTPKVVSS